MKEKKLVNFELGRADFDQLEGFCNQAGLSKSDVIRTGLEVVTHFDPETWQQLEALSKSINVPIWAVIQNFVIAQLAEIQAFQEVYGAPDLHFTLFAKLEAGAPFTGKPFADQYRQNRIAELEKDLAEDIVRKESLNRPLSTDERALLIRLHQGKAWYESDEYKQFCEDIQKREALLAKNKIKVEFISSREAKELVEQDRIAKAQKAEREKKQKPE